MKKTPSALKWLAESRGRIAHKHSANASVILLLEAKVTTLSSELRIAELMLSNAKENQLKLDSELKALDQTVQIFDERLDPTKIESIRGWQGGNPPDKPKDREVEFSKKEVLREEVEIYG
ncbi:hypothetical protein RAE19_04195 [Rhodoferax sp. TBRC 17660]|uniref:Uncharacterized protein n=1 Tax=Rhodoferax potami TaxID=3068338 RepID=A0ABU3KJI3_9BURK|nr:hypothetical protein [Rhodoferax sp. TBRC 17660]MDT7517945.1 hypothetical protein [Rhodoferax sp. TBRC 17660]